ncbi:MAG TPA: hypothetical protein VHY08_13075 [Bacillota bacterium]|nr:hypothetical protein [Bacillota bacterium]
MKKLLVILLCFLFATCIVTAAAPAKISDVFLYDEARMDVGSVYHYIGSDIEGNNGIDFYIYVQSKDSIVVYKGYDKLIPGSVYVINTTFDWEHMMRSKIEATNPLNNTLPQVEIGTKLNVNFKEKKVSISYTRNDESGKPKLNNSNYKYKVEPCFDYGFFHFDLQFALRFLKEGVDIFRVSSTYSGIVAESEIKLLKDETVNNIPCKKYEIRGLGILAEAYNVKGQVWIAKNDPRHYTVKYLNYVQKDNFWPNFRLELVDIKTMDAEQWKDFVKQLLAKANQ